MKPMPQPQHYMKHCSLLFFSCRSFQFYVLYIVCMSARSNEQTSQTIIHFIQNENVLFDIALTVWHKSVYGANKGKSFHFFFTFTLSLILSHFMWPTFRFHFGNRQIKFCRGIFFCSLLGLHKNVSDTGLNSHKMTFLFILFFFKQQNTINCTQNTIFAITNMRSNERK